MSKNFNKKKCLIIGAMILAAGFLFGPTTVKAATTVYFDSEKPTIFEGDTFIVNLKISTPDKSINVIDGTILYDSNGLEIKEISTGGSLFVLWPKPPTFSNDKGTLSFVGGISGGFQDKKGEVLKIIFLAKSEGEAKIDFLDGFSVFLHDGQGTSINPWLRPFSLDILKRPADVLPKDEWQALVEKDKTPPEFIEAIINRDPRLFDNQYFVSFSAADKDSGVAYYEIKEGERDFIRAESPYLLQDQSLKGIVQIKAADKAGNESAITPELAPAPGIPYKIYLIWGLIILAVLTLVFWLWRLWRRGWKLALFLGFFAFLIFSAKAANAATLYFSPSSGNFTVGNIFTVSVLVNTEKADINNAEATVNFPSGLLEVVSFSKSGSIFSLWVEEPKFSNGAGTLSLNGGLPTPGFKGAAGKVLGVVFRVKKGGSASLIFSSAAIRANDGYGTNVFRTGLQASFNLISEEKQLPPPEEKLIPVEGQTITITSSTHPDQSKWYPNKNPVFKWDLPAGVSEVILVLSRRTNSVPIISYIPPTSEKVLTDIEDGVWYLNGRIRTASGLGPITSFKFNVDTQPPRDFSVTRLDTDDLTNPQPQLAFATTDDISGIDRYEMKIGEGDWFRIDAEAGGKPYKLPLQAPGTREISVKAFDRADNSTTTTTTTTTTTIETPIIEQTMPPKIKPGFPLIIAGLAKPEQKVLVFIQYLSKYSALISSPAVIRLETIADSVGRWHIEYVQSLPKGKHQIYARTVDERGAISDPSNYVTFEVISRSVFDRLLELLFRGFDSLVNFLSEGWFLIAAGVSVAALVVLIIRRVVPFIANEIRKVRFITSEYGSLKKLKKIDSKTKLEVRMLQKDIREELELLKKISNHRRLHPEEQYLRDKLERYSNLIKSMKG